MGEKKNRLVLIIPILVIAAIAVSYLYGWEIGAHFHPDATAYDMAQLTGLVNEQIDAGKENGVFYIKGISEEEIADINDYVCSMNGVVSQYSVLEKTRSGMRVMLKYDISDNYYVYECYANGKQIPGDRPEAVKLYGQVETILDSIITEDMNDYEKELAIHDYIVSNCEYGYVDYSKEYAYRAYGVLVQQKAVCNGYAEAMALLLCCADVENKIMTGWADGELHAWNRVKLDGEWYQVDATWDDPIPDRGSYVGHMYFNVTDDIMDDSHTWEAEGLEPCDSMDCNYFKLNNLICDYNGFKAAVREEASRNITGTLEVVLTDYDEALYTFDFMQEIQGLMYFQRSSEIESYGPYRFITIYLNQKD